MKIKPTIIILFLLFVPIENLLAQADTVSGEIPDSIMEKRHSPTKATLMSACIPGLGQIYNKKYWKVPIIYAGFGIMSYFIYFNTDEYLNFKCAYIEKINGDTQGNYSYLVNRYSAEELLSAREYYRRNLEISCLITALWYVLNIIDAAVDAHLYTYNISKNLSLKITPGMNRIGQSTIMASGIMLSLKF
jgi:hypothetical protein